MKEFIIKNTDIWKIFLKYYRSDEEIVFLHSSQATENEHYSILAHKPYKKVSKYKGQVFFNGEKKKFNFLDAVDLLKNEKVERPKNWPFYPELLGFVSYEQDPAYFAAMMKFYFLTIEQNGYGSCNLNKLMANIG